MTTRKTVIIPDIQYPYHDRSMWEKILDVIDDVQPDQILLGGDGPDFKEVSRWSKGTAEEYKATLGDNVLGFRAEILVPLSRTAPKAVKRWLRGNHCERISDFTRQYGFPLQFLKRWEDGEDLLSMENLFGLKPLGISYEKGPIEIAPNTIALHGHEVPGYAASPTVWDAKFLKRYGSEWNVVFFHTHAPFLLTSGHGFHGEIKNRWVMNAGSIMRPKDADYVKDGSVSWTHSLAVISDDGTTTWPELIIAQDGSFVYGGDLY